MSDPLEWEDDARNFKEYEEFEPLDVEAELVEMEGTEPFFYALVVADVLLLALVVLGIVAIVKL